MTKDQRENIEHELNRLQRVSDMWEAKADKAYEEHDDERQKKFETKVITVEERINGMREVLLRLGYDAIHPMDGYSRDYSRYIVVDR